MPDGSLPGPGTASPSEAWRAMAGFADHVAQHWREPDAGIWEIRRRRAASCALQAHGVARARSRASYRRHPTTWWPSTSTLADTNATQSRKRCASRGFDEARGTYTRSYGSDELDASLLVLPLLGIEPPDGPRVRGTIDAIMRELDAGGPLLYRYPPGRDGLIGTEGAFLPCAFWLVQALAKSGRISEATDRFAALVDLATPLGLYAEEMDPTDASTLATIPRRSPTRRSSRPRSPSETHRSDSEIYRPANASSRRSRCSCRCTVRLPVAGLSDSGRLATRNWSRARVALHPATHEGPGADVLWLLLQPDDFAACS